jgi:hypothetical protein
MGAQTISDAVARALLRLKTTKVNYHPAFPFLSALFASPRVPSLTFNYNTDTFEPLIHVPRTPPCARTKMKVHAQNLFKKAASSALVIPPALQPNQINDAGIAPTTCARFRKAHKTLGPPAAFLSHPSPAVLSSPPSRPVTKTITQKSSVWNPSQNGCAVAFQDLVQLSRFATRFLLSGTLRSSGRTEFVTRHHTRASRHGSVPS